MFFETFFVCQRLAELSQRSQGPPNTAQPLSAESSSYSYHSDNGGMHHGTGIPPQHVRLTYGPGDIVGCGLEYKSRRIFFTKNGKFLGYEFGKIGRDVVESGLYPTVGVDSECPIFVNFGGQPFTFDLKDINV